MNQFARFFERHPDWQIRFRWVQDGLHIELWDPDNFRELARVIKKVKLDEMGVDEIMVRIGEMEQSLEAIPHVAPIDVSDGRVWRHHE